jgi:hypothetical protein
MFGRGFRMLSFQDVEIKQVLQKFSGISNGNAFYL